MTEEYEQPREPQNGARRGYGTYCAGGGVWVPVHRPTKTTYDQPPQPVQESAPAAPQGIEATVTTPEGSE